MKSGQSKLVIEICCRNAMNGCREVCPLADACVYIEGETKELFDRRMNTAASIMKITYKKEFPASFE